jgi:16S rRNA (guanine966-N2)-methyltransferase
MSLEPLHGLRVIDLYAGSGALGIEALSRGAVHADFVESDRGTLETLRGNLEQLGLTDRSRVWPLELPRGLARLAGALGQADLVLADPPYGGEEARALLTVLGRAELAPHVRVVVEHHGKDEIDDRWGGLVRERQRRYGETVVSTYRRAADAAQAVEEER